MKKLTTTILGLALCTAMSTTALVAGPITNNNGTDSAQVKGTYQAAEAPADVFSVNVAWGSMEFTYTDGSKGTWNPEILQYDNSESASWSYADGANKVTVENRSNVEIKASFTYGAKEGYEGIDVAFTGDGQIFDPTNKALVLSSAEGKTVAPKGEVLVVPNGELPSDTTSQTALGTVTVTIWKR